MNESPAIVVSLGVAAAFGALWLRRSDSFWHDTIATVVISTAGAAAVYFERPDLAVWLLLGSVVGLIHLCRRPTASGRTDARTQPDTPTRHDAVTSLPTALFAIVAAAVLEQPAVTILLWWTVAARREPRLLAALLFLPAIALSDTVSTSTERAAVALLLIVLTAASRPRRDLVTMLSSTVLSVIWMSQSASTLSGNVLATSVFAAVLLLYAFVAARSVSVASNDEILSILAASLCGQVLLAVTLVWLLPDHRWLGIATCFASMALLLAAVVLQPRDCERMPYETLDVWAGRARTEPSAMVVVSAVLLSALPIVPLVQGVLWNVFLSEAFASTRTDPQPVFAIACLAMCGPLTLVPMVYRVLSRIWQAEPRVSRIEWPIWRLLLGVLIVASPLLFLVSQTTS